MNNSNRRDFLKSAAAIGATATAKATPENVLSDDRMGVLVDTTVCIGCRHCEWACQKAHDMPHGELEEYQNRDVFKEQRRPCNDSLTVINEYQNVANPIIPINVKVQCMHCDRPACVSACIVGAFTKQENGSVY